MRSKISQREAHRLRKRVGELETILRRQANTWADDFIGGTHLGSVKREGEAIGLHIFGRLEAARMLKHAVVVQANDNCVKFFALPLKVDSIL